MNVIVGIDLGTTYSAISALDPLGKPSVIPNYEGERLTPSVIAFSDLDPPEVILVGRPAKHVRDSEPKNVVTEIKRHMGEEGRERKFRGRIYRPEDLSAIIIRKLCNDASAQIGEISEAVITVPAYFSEPHRRATMDAGEIAGIRVTSIINEPTAAALFYATTHEINGNIVVFDLGGGTFDVTVMRVSGRSIDIIASEGDRHLGGIDFDRVFSDIVNQKFSQQTGDPAFSNELDVQKFLNEAEQKKQALSARPSQRLVVHSATGRAQISIDRGEFEEGISPLIAKAEMLVEAVLDEANLDPGELSKVLLVGGSSRIPFVQKRLEAIFGFPPVTEVNLDEAVACGAAIHSGLSALEHGAAFVPAGVRAGLGDVKLTDVANRSYGTTVLARDEETGRPVMRNDIIIAKGSPLPCSQTRTYYTVSDGQRSIEIDISEGESEDPENNETLYREKMELPPNRPGGRPIEVTYSYDRNQRMACTFTDIESGHSFEIELTQTDGGISAESKRRSRARLEEFQID